jgi:hypothetical protein
LSLKAIPEGLQTKPPVATTFISGVRHDGAGLVADMLAI